MDPVALESSNTLAKNGHTAGNIPNDGTGTSYPNMPRYGLAVKLT